MSVINNIKKLFKLKSYIYGHISFLRTLKAFNPKSVYLAFLLGTLTLLFEGLGVSILVPLLSFIQVDGDIEKLTSDLSNILGWVEQLNDVNTDDVIPMFSGVADTYLRFREDEVTEGNQQKEVLSNAPDSFDGLFAVPKVLE